MAIKLKGGGGKALMAWPLVEDFFFRATLTYLYTHILETNFSFNGLC